MADRRAALQFVRRNGWVAVAGASIAAAFVGGTLAIFAGGTLPTVHGQAAPGTAATAPTITLTPPGASGSGVAPGSSVGAPTQVLGLTINSSAPKTATVSIPVGLPTLQVPVPPTGAIGAVNCNSSGGTCSVTRSGISVTGAGSGGLTLAQYATDPVSAPEGFEPSGPWFDVRVGADQAFDAVTLDQCNLRDATSLYWWNPTGGAASGGWESVIGSPGPTFTAGPPACLATTLRAVGTSPTLSQLTGTIFVAGKRTPPSGPSAPATTVTTAAPTKPTRPSPPPTTTTTTKPKPPVTTPGPPGSTGPPGSGGITTTPSGAVFNVTGMVPGDSAPASLSVQTTSRPAANVTLAESNRSGALATQLRVKITQDGTDVIYDGALNALGTLTLVGNNKKGGWSAGEAHTYTFLVTFPSSSGNAFQKATASLDFVWKRN